MPQAYGNDRLTIARGERYVLLSPLDKGWIPRRQRTPGTTVAWDGALYEAVEAQPHGSGVRYLLEPWDERHVIRHSADYDADSEAARLAAHARSRRDDKFSLALVLGSFFVGQIPAYMQRRIETRFGLSAERMTMFSTIPYFLFGAFCGTRMPVREIDRFIGGPTLPGEVVALGFFFFIESIVRFRFALANGPIASIAGTLVTLPLRLFIADTTKGRRTKATGIPDRDVALQDAFAVREPIAALLPIEDQLRIQARFGFDPILWGKRTAATILGIAGIGAAVELASLASGFAFGSMLSGLVALALCLEQIQRWRALARGRPAGSILGYPLRGLFKVILAP